jgi:GT2 family glycosyltransferase
MSEKSPIEMIHPLVSIVIPTYNHLDLLKKCLDSVLAYTDLSMCEVVVVANGCADETESYLRSLPPPFRHVVWPEPMGYTRATNVGIAAAKGEYVVLLNNDTVLLQQRRNEWIEILLAPLRGDSRVGVTGPVKFSWDCGGIERRAIAFWCAMIHKRLFGELGDLDEIFSPGMGEDGDFCIKAEQAGYRLVQVPTDGVHQFGGGVKQQQNFPIYHVGSGTFGHADYSDIQKRNSRILVERYGKMDNLEATYQACVVHECDTNKLFPVLRKYAEQCKHITEFGVRGVFTTWAFLAARPKKLISYDIEYNGNIEGAKKEAAKAGIPFEFRQENTLHAEIEETDLLFVDTKHTYSQLINELNRHARKVSKWIAIHDTEFYGEKGEDGGLGEKQAIKEFLGSNTQWIQKEHIEMSNGLTILERKMSASVEVSIVIPTCGKDWESVLKGCLERVFEFTDLTNKQVIVVANGAPSEALNYLSTKKGVTLLEYRDRIGYIKAVNIGVQVSRGTHVVLLDDDSLLMPQEKDTWIKMLLKPFQEESWAIGIRKGNDPLKTRINVFLKEYRAIGGFDKLGDSGRFDDRAGRAARGDRPGLREAAAGAT